MKNKMNKELKEYLYMLVGKELTRQDYEKILDYFNRVKQEKDHYKNKTLNNLYMKDFGGEKVFCLEDDKETYRDMIFELQERIDKAIESLNYYIEGMNKSLEIWNKVKEDEKIDDDTLLQMLEREKQNYIDLLDILKGCVSNGYNKE